MPFAEDNDMVKTIPSDRTDEPLRMSVLPWRSWCESWSVPNAHRANATDKDIAIDTIPIANEFFLPVRVLSRLFRRLFLQKLKNAFGAGKLRFFTNLANLAEPQAFARRLRELQRLDWVVYAKPPFGGPGQVLAYLGRYTHRVAIANSRLLSLADGKIRFTWKDYRADGKTKVMTLDADEFIRRFLLHALPDGFHRIRHYGFLANGARGDSLALCRRLLEDRVTSAVREPTDNHTRGDRPFTAADFAICPDCGGTMRRIAVVPRSCNPQPFSCDTS